MAAETTTAVDVDNDNKNDDKNQSDEKHGKPQQKSWMQQLGEYAVWGWIRCHIEKQYKAKIYIPVAIKGECVRFLGVEFIDSNILTSNKQKDLLFELLSQQSMHSNILSGMKLLYRASENQFDATQFHTLCDNQENIITIIQSKKESIFGGYTKVGFKTKKGFIEDDKAFLFSIDDESTNVYNIDKWETEYALKSQPTSGPCFGGGFDLFICDKCDAEKQSYIKVSSDSYNIQNATKFCGSTDNWESKIKFTFFVKDYEVFQFLA